jgi:hypothetical protein
VAGCLICWFKRYISSFVNFCSFVPFKWKLDVLFESCWCSLDIDSILLILCTSQMRPNIRCDAVERNVFVELDRMGGNLEMDTFSIIDIGYELP